MKKWTKRVITLIVVFFVVLLAIGIFLLSRSRKPSISHVTGIIDGIEVNLSSKVAGKISRISCNEGDKVQAGQVVITLESDDIKASLEQAMAGVERAKANVNVAEASIENSRANVRRCRSGGEEFCGRSGEGRCPDGRVGKTSRTEREISTTEI